MSKYFDCQILADGFALNLQKWKNSRCQFSYWYYIIGHEVKRNILGREKLLWIFSSLHAVHGDVFDIPGFPTMNIVKMHYLQENL